MFVHRETSTFQLNFVHNLETTLTLAQAEQNLKRLGLKRIDIALYVLLQKSNEDTYLTLCSIFYKIFHA